jgi:hypothetical protein
MEYCAKSYKYRTTIYMRVVLEFFLLNPLGRLPTEFGFVFILYDGQRIFSFADPCISARRPVTQGYADDIGADGYAPYADSTAKMAKN